ncbi:hypothetical protein LCGC14_1668300 [marine sediment metagenome]|uniref:Uncharacterized protein n=1 Tax=marine sediment metagenome TaxID=412755 RepID=A0A0F9HSV2_9ZZZZ
MYRMSFAVTITPDGLYHVQNGVAGLSGQHHVHSAASFKRWRKDGDDIRQGKGDCACGLAVGDVRGHTGKIWHNEEFE